MSTSTPASGPARIALQALAVVLAIAVVVIAVLWFIQRDRVLPNTFVASVDVGGMTEVEVRAAIEPLAEERQQTPVTFTFEDEQYEVTPEQVGYEIDVDQAVQAALERGREGLPGDIGARIGAYRRTANIDLAQQPHHDGIREWTESLADELDRDEVRGDVQIDPETADVTVERPIGGVEVDREATFELVLNAFRAEPDDDEEVEVEDDPFELPADTTDKPIADDDIDALAQQAEAAVDGPLTLHEGGRELTLDTADIANLIAIEEVEGGQTGTTLALEVSEERVEETIADTASSTFNISPVESTYTADREPPEQFDEQGDTTYEPEPVSVGVEPGSDGVRFDAATAAAQLQDLVREGAREAELELEVWEPELGPDDAEQWQPTHAIGTFTTYYQPDQDRNDNIQLLADELDGTTVLPDQSFSINDISGPRTCERGYVPAATIVQGEFVDTCGGGTSQVGTTVLNAAFFAGVQLDQWQAHSLYVSRYPIGREATLSYPALDVKFTNNTDGVVVVKTAHDDESITVTLLGVPRAEAVSAEHSDPFDQSDYGTEIRSASDLNSGQERVIQQGAEGFTVTVDRIIQLGNGDEETQEIRTVYRPQNAIIERG